jgi:class 3 adenylate cyclase
LSGERVERRLVAILAADVEGYSRLMGTDEVSTLRNLTQRRTILDGLIAAHRGRIANTAGDSVLAEFGSAVMPFNAPSKRRRPLPKPMRPCHRTITSTFESAFMLAMSW